MPRIQRLLDLAKIDDWFSVTNSIVQKLIPEEIRNELKSFDPEEMYEDTMTFLVDCCTRQGHYREGECIEVEDWAGDFDASFLKRYTHIRGFHACRAFGGLELYRQHGIRKLSRELLRELAHLAFQGHSAPAAIDAAVAQSDLPSHEKSVFLFTDEVTPLDCSCNHFLHSGSEMLQALSIDLGLDSRGILASQGSPYLIECSVPIRHVSKGNRQELWRKFVTEYFKVASGSLRPTEPYDFSIRVTKSIEPTSIVGFRSIDRLVKSYVPLH